MKAFPQEKILKDDKVLFAKWKANTVSTRQFVLMRENAFVFVVKGKKVIVRNEQTLAIDTKQLLVLKKGVHQLTEYLAHDGSFEAVVIYFRDLFIKLLNPINDIETSQPDIAGQDLIIVDRNRIINSFLRQYFSYIQNNENDPVILELKVAELIYLLSREHPKCKQFFASISRQGNDLKDMMEKLYKENFTIGQLAEISNRSLSKFKRDFARIFRVTPAKWIVSRKLSDARLLLVNTDKTISEIAYECGFETLSQLDKSFRRQFNTTPSSFRSTAVNQIDKS